MSLNGDDLIIDGTPFDLEMEYTPGDRMIEAAIRYPVRLTAVEAVLPSGELGGKQDDATNSAQTDRLTVKIERPRAASHYILTARGAARKVHALPAHVAPFAAHMIEKAPPDLSRYLLAPMPGLLTALHVTQGERVELGQPLGIIEAMKMENILRAGKAGIVKSVGAAPGQSLAVDAIILEIE